MQEIRLSNKTNKLELDPYSYQLQDVEEPNLYRELYDYTSIPKVAFNNRVVPMNMPDEIWMTDTTFRDGQQSTSPFTVEQIVHLFKLMSRLSGPNGVVRQSPKALVRQGDTSALPVKGMRFSYDRAGVEAAIAETYRLPGVYYVRVWLNEGELQVGDDIMYVLLGGDIRPHVIDALQFLVGRIKSQCVEETELR